MNNAALILSIAKGMKEMNADYLSWAPMNPSLAQCEMLLNSIIVKCGLDLTPEEYSVVEREVLRELEAQALEEYYENAHHKCVHHGYGDYECSKGCK